MSKKNKIEAQRVEYGRIEAGGYIFTRHFFRQWRDRYRNSPSDEKIAIDAAKRLRGSYLIKIKPNGEELRESRGLVFAIENRIVKTVMFSFTRHKVEGNDEFQWENNSQGDSKFQRDESDLAPELNN